MENAGKYNIFLMLGTQTDYEFTKVGFIGTKSYDEVITQDDKRKNLCIVDGIRIRMFDFNNAASWWDKADNFKKGNMS